MIYTKCIESWYCCAIQYRSVLSIVQQLIRIRFLINLSFVASCWWLTTAVFTLSLFYTSCTASRQKLILCLSFCVNDWPKLYVVVYVAINWFKLYGIVLLTDQNSIMMWDLDSAPYVCGCSLIINALFCGVHCMLSKVKKKKNSLISIAQI